MKKAGFIALLLTGLFACRNKNIPDVSDIKVTLETQRFEQDFFAMDTADIMASLEKLGQKYPQFLNDFLYNILTLPPVTDTSYAVHDIIRSYIRDYRPIKDSSDLLYKSFDKYEKEIKQGLQFVKYYFPSYNPPPKLISFIGPLEGYSDVITSNALAVGLQLHLGKDFSFYNSEIGQQSFPSYISRWFTPEMIPVNCLKNIVADIYPENLSGKALVEQMVEKGKQLYFLDKVLPYTADTLKIGYSDKQLQGCYNNEGQIWNFFLTNQLLYKKESDIIRGYLDESPNTPEMGNESPGAIGLFVGWQIVKKYMEKNEKVTLEELLKTDARKIFEESKYKPN